MHKHDNIIIEHRGALGDFFLAWPAMARLRLWRADSPAYFHGRLDRLSWLAPLGIQPCPPQLASAVDSLHTASDWPRPLTRSLVARFSLVPASGMTDPRLWHLRGVLPGAPGRHVSPEAHYARQLDLLGVPAGNGWRAVWRERLPTWNGPDGKRTALVFPGAGHRLKQWPLVKFFELADRLTEFGLSPVFVPGPAEVERGLDLDGRPAIIPADLPELQNVLLGARVAVGNDCGPMHLAGRLGVPGVAVFGPTSRRQWAPEGIMALAASPETVPCRPCTLTTHDLRCPVPACLDAVSVDMVAEAVGRLLAT